MAKSPSKPRAPVKAPTGPFTMKSDSRASRKGALTPAAVVKEQMPGWQIAKGTVSVAGSFRMSDMKSETGPTIEQLRRKFLGHQDAGIDAPALGEVDQSVQTVRVRPRDGGPAKTADIRNGKISIVQG